MAKHELLYVSIIDGSGDTQHAAIRDTANEIHQYLRQFGLSLGDAIIDPTDDSHYIVTEIPE